MSIPRKIAIDGPVASGKNAVGSLLAKRLGYCLVDTGAMYRALTWKAIQLGIDPADMESLSRLATETEMEASCAGDDCEILMDGRGIGAEIRLEEVERSVSLVSMVPRVRHELVNRQREIAERRPVVMIGRDIGTVVLPDADLKIYLSASAEERARRRYHELAGKGVRADYEKVLADLRRRDKLDSERSLSPLKPAADAEFVDTDNLNVEQVYRRIMKIIKSRQ